MPNPDRQNPKVRARIDLGRIRVAKVLRTYQVAHLKTLEQKISDAGPGHMRVEPILLSHAIKDMLKDGALTKRENMNGTTWYHLSRTPQQEVADRLAVLTPVWASISDPKFRVRLGQALEIAIFKALSTAPYRSMGAFRDLAEHDDSTPYSKEEPPTIISGLKSKGPLDFLAFVGNDMAGIEAKNVREWFYPDNTTVLGDFLLKCIDLNVVPVLIARRISYVAFSEILRPCGVLVHEVFNQRYPSSAADIAAQAADKTLLGFHDIRASTEPDARLVRFLHETLPNQIAKARLSFDEHKDILRDLVTHQMSYKDFHTELRIRLGIYERSPDRDE